MLSIWECFARLGLRSGYKYWRLYRSAAKDPEIILNWVDVWEEASVHLHEAGFCEEAQLLSTMANEARHIYNNYHKQNERRRRHSDAHSGECDHERD